MNMRNKIKIFIASLAVLFAVLGYAILWNDIKEDEKAIEVGGGVVYTQETTTEEPSTEEPTTEEPTEPPVITVSLKMIGDMLLHEPVQETGLMADGSYQYDHYFTHILSDIQSADVAIVNQEVIIGGAELGISGYPCFNCREEVGDALVKAGFDVVLHATNHAMDKGNRGIENCLNFWNNRYPQITYLGIHQTQEDAQNIYVYEKEGFKIAMLNYTYGLNGISLPDGRPYLVDMLTGSNEEKIRADIAKAKEISDFVVVLPHWGTEYVYEPDSNQLYWTNVFAECGVDLVIGTHPHVIEPVTWVDRPDGEKMLVYYSLGNFISAQKKAPRMLGAMADVTLEKTVDGKVSIRDYKVIPLVTHRIFGAGAITTYKLADYTEELAQQNTILSEDSSFSIDMMKNLCRQVFGELYQE